MSLIRSKDSVARANITSVGTVTYEDGKPVFHNWDFDARDRGIVLHFFGEDGKHERCAGWTHVELEAIAAVLPPGASVLLGDNYHREENR